ncbi:hypothetical protein HK104_010073 [Borealophlyctis nickersoniae]|nr:hypothetical protein HK104_010073 [Borealophlyctis nickersoniae]
MTLASSFYSIKVNDSRGQPFDLAEHCQGKVVMVVNVASKCGKTPQYAGLEALYQKYKDRGFIILGLPCNQFAGQEPGTAEEVVMFCSRTYNVTFPILEKVKVNGDDAHPIYQYLKAQKAGLLGLRMVKWNFEKFILDREGNVVERYASNTTPEALDAKVQALL